MIDRTADAKKQYEEEGYVIFRNVLDPKKLETMWNGFRKNILM